MGEYTHFCAICGAGFEWGLHPPAEKLRPEYYQGGNTEAENAKMYDGNVQDSPDVNILNEDRMRWLEVTRMLAQNTELPEKPGFLSGVGRWEEHTLEVDRGFNPNAPVSMTSGTEPSKGDLFGYDEYSSLSGMGFLQTQTDLYGIHPVHDACIKVFIYALKIRKGMSTRDSIDIDWTSVFELMGGIGVFVMSGKSKAEARCSLPYYEMNETAGGQFFDARHGLEPYLADPLRIGDFRSPEVWGYLFFLSGRKSNQPAPRDEASHTNETKLEWFKRIKADLPWLWELHESIWFSEVADWKEIYARARELSFLKEWNRYRWYDHNAGRITEPGFYTDAKGQRLTIPAEEIQDYSFVRADLLGIASRRRIWQCLQPIIDKYLELEAMNEETDSNESNVVDETDEDDKDSDEDVDIEDELDEESSSKESSEEPRKRQKWS